MALGTHSAVFSTILRRSGRTLLDSEKKDICIRVTFGDGDQYIPGTVKMSGFERIDRHHQRRLRWEGAFTRDRTLP